MTSFIEAGKSFVRMSDIKAVKYSAEYGGIVQVVVPGLLGDGGTMGITVANLGLKIEDNFAPEPQETELKDRAEAEARNLAYSLMKLIAEDAESDDSYVLRFVGLKDGRAPWESQGLIGGI